MAENDAHEPTAAYSYIQPQADRDRFIRSQTSIADSPAAKFDQIPTKTKEYYEFLFERDEDTIQEPSTKQIMKAIFLHIAITLTVISTILALLFISISPKPFTAFPGSCYPDGNFRFLQDYNPWATSGLFQITMGFGLMSFSNAKLIDVIWDVVVGRGGINPFTRTA
jgi:hypothetical protein